MKLEIYDEKKVEEEKKVRLRLVKNWDGHICLRAVDEDGDMIDRCALVYFSKEGHVGRYLGVNPDLGFDLDEKGRIKLDDEVK